MRPGSSQNRSQFFFSEIIMKFCGITEPANVIGVRGLALLPLNSRYRVQQISVSMTR